MVTDGIALLVDHLEHFHYKAKAVALDGLLALSAVGLGPDRRLDPGGAALMAAGAGGTAAAGSLSASSAAILAAAAGGACQGASGDEGIGARGGGSDPKQVADAVTALGGLGLGDWLALRIVGAGALPRLLELLTHRTGVNFVQHRHVASQVVHNLARRRCTAVRAALARWRPLPGLISGLDVVLEDNPDIAARLLLALGDLLPTTSHQIAGVLHKLIAKHKAAQQPAAQPPTQMGAAKSGDGPGEAACGKAPSDPLPGAEVVEGEVQPTATLPEPAHLGLAPDVDVPLEQLLLRVCGYYMRLCFNAVFAPAALPQLPAFRPPANEADKRENDRAYARFKLEDYRRRRKESGQLDCCVAALLAAAPMPSALFESMSYSYQRALAVLAGPPPGSALTATTSGGLWRAQDLLPYALAVLQSLGGGVDTGDGCGGSGILPTAPPAGGGGLLADFLAGTSVATAAGGGGNGDGVATISGLCSGTTTAVAAALDATWGLAHPRQAVLGGLGPAGAGAVLDGCQGPSLPGAPYGNRPVSDAVLERYGAVVRAVLERAVQAADGLPAAAAATATALASAASGGNGSAVTLLRQAAAEAPPLVVLRAVGSTLASITRVQVADQIASSNKECLVRLAASLSPHTGSAAAAAAQARCALGLANIWSCLHSVSSTSRERRQEERQQQVVAQSDAVVGGASEDADLAPASAAPPPAPTMRRGGQAAATSQMAVRRSSRIKRRRDGGGIQEEEAKLRPTVPGAEDPAPPETSFEGAPVSMPRQPAQAAEPLNEPEDVQGQAELLSAMVTLLASRFAEARVIAESTSGQEREGEASTVATSAAPAAVAPAPWQADRGRQASEVQALLLQATALLLPGLDAAAARRLVDSGAALCAARVVRTSLAVSAVAAPAHTGPLGFGAAVLHPPTPPQPPPDLESVAAGLGEQQYGVSSAQALGLLVDLLRLASAGGGGGFAAAGLHNPEVMAALGGALLLAKRGPALPRAASASVLGSAVPGSSSHACGGDENGDLASEPSASCWDLLQRLASGSRHSAGHDLLLQLLPPLLALTHGPSARCAAARARLLPVLTSVAGRWSHSRPQCPRPGVGAPLVAASSGQPLVVPAVVELVRTTMERLGDAEVVRLLHTTGWLRALCHGARCADPAIRASCMATLRASARCLVDAAVGAASTTGGPSTGAASGLPSASELPLSLHLVVSDIAAEATVRHMLLIVEPSLATLLRPAQSAAAAALKDVPEDRIVAFHGALAGETDLAPEPPPRRSSRRAAVVAAAALASSASVPPPKGRKAAGSSTSKRASRPGGSAAAAGTTAVVGPSSAGPTVLPSNNKRRRLGHDEAYAQGTAAGGDGADAVDAAGTANNAAADASPSRNAPLQLQLSVREGGLAVAVRRSCMMLEAALASRRHDLAAVLAANQAASAASALAATVAVAAGAPTVGPQPSPRPLSPKRTTRSRTAGGLAGLPATSITAAVAPLAPVAAPAVASAAQPALVGDEEFLARTYRSISKKLNFDDL